VYQSALQLLSYAVYYDSEPVEPPLDVFFDVIRSILELPNTAEKTRDVAILVLVCSTVNRSPLNIHHQHSVE